METATEEIWFDALAEAVPQASATAYAKSLAKHFVDLGSAKDLTAAEFQELGVLIGHRKSVAQAASQAYAKLQSNRPAECNDVMVDETSPSFVTSASGKLEQKKVCEDFSVTDRWNSGSSLKWVDMTGSFPTLAQFLTFMGDSLNQTGLRDTPFHRAFLDNKPMPLQMNESVGRMFLFRIPDLNNEKGDTLASITNRVVVWWPLVGDVVYTYHRCDVSPFAQLEEEWAGSKFAGATTTTFFNAAVRSVLRTYRQGAKKLQERSDSCEDQANGEKMIWGLTSVSKQAGVYSRCLQALNDMFAEVRDEDSDISADCSIHCDNTQTLATVCSELNENATSSINMQMALDGFRSSVNMKIFTYMSVVCQPIGVATGWYGMNFTNMPELLYDDSYFAFIGIVLGIVFVLLCWLIYRSMVTGKK